MNTIFEPVPTRAALAMQQKNKINSFHATVFEEPKRSVGDDERELNGTPLRKSNKVKESMQGNKNEPLEFDIKKARHEVLNFAMSNQRTLKNKRKMQIFQAVKLGAKPQKKPYKNYKELLDERKRLKTIREERKKFHQLGKNQTGAASVKCKSKTKLEKQQKKRAPVASIAQNYGVVKSKLKKKK